MKPEMKKLIIANLPYLLFVYLFGKLGQTYRLAAGADLSEKLLHLADGFSLAFESAAPSFHLFDLAVGVAGAVALRLMVYCKSKNAKKYRRGVEYGSARWYFCDEFHLLLREEQTAAFSCEIWKRFRKWGGIPTGATQNVKDLLSSPEIENILENSDFICLLNQASGDRKILAERLNISPQQLRYVDNSEPGEGLLIYENVILPFKNPIPKNTQLYQIMTTRLGEGATV